MDAERLHYLRDWHERHKNDRDPPAAWSWHYAELLEAVAFWEEPASDCAPPVDAARDEER